MITIPEIIIYNNLNTLMSFYNDDYKRVNQATVFGYNDMRLGYNWGIQPQNCTINNKVVQIDTYTTDVASTVKALNKSIVASGLKNIEFFPIQNIYVGLRTCGKSDQVQSLSIQDGNGLLTTLCILAGDYSGKTTKEDTYIYNIFKNLSFDRYIYLDEIALLLNNTYANDSTDKLKKRSIIIKTDFNPNPDNRMPIIVISLTSEQQDDNMITRGMESNPTNSINIRQRKIDANYKLSIISDSKNETILLYNFLKSIIESNTAFFYHTGLVNLSVKGGDVLSEIEMPNFFTQVISLSFSYINEIPELINKEDALQNLYFKGHFIADFDWK